MEATAGIRLPWLTIWYRPRETIRTIVETNVDYGVLPLAALAGLTQTINRAGMRAVGDHLDTPALLSLIFVAGPIGGIVWLYISGAVLAWVGKRLGGQAEFDEVRAALAWTSIPLIALTALTFLPEFLLVGGDVFTTSWNRLDQWFHDSSMGGLMAVLYVAIILFLTVIGNVWYVVIYLKAMSEIHRFSVWRAAATTIIPFVGLLISIGVIAWLLGDL